MINDLLNELVKHGYMRRSTGTEYAFMIIDRLLNIVERGDYRGFVEAFKNIVSTLSRERPASMASWNLLRSVGEYFLKKGFTGLKEYMLSLRDKYDRTCWEAANVAAKRIVDGDTLMTISNSLCVRRLFKLLVDNNVKFQVYVLESRPGMEGLDTASYLDELGVKTHLIVDSAARFFMKNVKRVVIGAEAIAANGALVGKVGTSLLCLIANEARVRVFAITPLYKFSFETIHGELITLPEADWRYLMNEEVRKSLPEKYDARVPIYDVTPPNYIDGIATEYGLFAPQAIPVIIKQFFGGFPPKMRSIEDIIREMEVVVKK